MSLKTQIEEQLKQALKSGNQLELSALRFLLAGVKNKEIETLREATDEDVVAVVQKQVKQHKESIEAFKKANREDLFQKEEEELAILNKFLPQQLNPEEIKKVVLEAVASLAESEQPNFGKVMGLVMAKVKGRAEGNIVAQAVKEVLQ